LPPVIAAAVLEMQKAGPVKTGPALNAGDAPPPDDGRHTSIRLGSEPVSVG